MKIECPPNLSNNITKYFHYFITKGLNNNLFNCFVFNFYSIDFTAIYDKEHKRMRLFADALFSLNKCGLIAL